MRSPNKLLRACQMSYNGMRDEEISKSLAVSLGTLTNWRKTDLWKQLENELIDAQKQAIVKAQLQAAEKAATG